MKKLLFLALFIASINVSAQTEFGKCLISGSTNASLLMSTPDGSDNKSFNVNVSPAYGYFVAKNVAMGLSFAISYTELNNSYYSSNQTVFQFSPFIRYYIASDSSKAKFFVQLEGGYMNSNKNTGYFFSGGLGVSIFANQHIAFDIGASYLRTIVRSRATNTFGLTLGVSVFLGKQE